MEQKNNKRNFNQDINDLFEKIIAKRDQKLENIEELKRRISAKLDAEIKRLYAKKDFLADLLMRREILKLQKISVFRKLMRNSLAVNLRFTVSMPFIYMMIVPGLLLHVTLELYHQICFRLYGIPLVKASDYFVFDRRLLPYLNWFEKMNCFYCSYFNCLITYLREIAGRTERYWCPIKHSKPLKDEHPQYEKFVDYSDGEALRREWEELRKFEEE